MSGSQSQDVVLAVDVGGSAVKLAFVRADGSTDGVRRVPLDPEVRGEDAADAVVGTVHRALADAPAPCRAIGLALPGIVDPARGVGVYSVMLGWRDVPVRDLLERRVDLPVAVGHDVGAGAAAEQEWGAAQGHRDWLFLALGTGLGSALVLDGRPYRGAHAWGGELSHVQVDRDGPVCACGKRGCAETLFSGRGLAARYQERTGDRVDPAELVRRVDAGEAAAREVWDRGVKALVAVTANAAELLNPSCVVVGGGLAAAGPTLLDPLRDGLRDRVRFVQPPPTVLPATLGADAGAYGAGLLGWRALEESRSDDR